MMKRTKNSAIHLADRPFATALGVLLWSSGLITIFGLGLTHDALEAVVSPVFTNVLAGAYALAGLLLLAGMAFSRPDIEAAGCVLGFTGVLVRLIAVIVGLGFTPAVLSTVLLYIAVSWAFAERFRQILNHQQVIRVNGIIKSGGSDDRSVD
jgi:hypothetical protein